MAIAFVRGAVSTASTTAGTSKTITISPTAGDTVLVFGAGVGVAVSNVTDNATGGSSTYTKLAGPSTNTVEGELWGTAPGGVKSGVTTITVTFASSTRNAVGAVEYSGVNAFGNVNNSATGSSTSPQATITTQNANNVIVVGMSREGTSTWATHSGVGTLRESLAGGGSTTPGIGISDNTSATPASISAGATISATGAWCACGIELRSVSPIAAVINGTSTVTSALTGIGAIASSINGTSSLTANLIGLAPIAATINGTSSVIAAISGISQIAAVINGTSSVTGALTGTGAVAASVNGIGTVVAALTGKGALASSISGVASVTGVLTGTGAVAASIQGVGTVSGSLTGKGAVASVITGTSTVTGALTGTGAVVASIAGIGTVVVALAGTGTVAANVSGTSSITGALTGTGALAASIQGTSSVTANVTGAGSGAIAAVIQGTSTVTCNLAGKGSVAAAINGTTTVSAALIGQGSLSSTINGSSVLTGILIGTGALSAEIEGISAVVATITNKQSGNLSAFIFGSSKVTVSGLCMFDPTTVSSVAPMILQFSNGPATGGMQNDIRFTPTQLMDIVGDRNYPNAVRTMAASVLKQAVARSILRAGDLYVSGVNNMIAVRSAEDQDFADIMNTAPILSIM